MAQITMDLRRFFGVGLPTNDTRDAFLQLCGRGNAASLLVSFQLITFELKTYNPL